MTDHYHGHDLWAARLRQIRGELRRQRFSVRRYARWRRFPPSNLHRLLNGDGIRCYVQFIDFLEDMGYRIVRQRPVSQAVHELHELWHEDAQQRHDGPGSPEGTNGTR